MARRSRTRKLRKKLTWEEAGKFFIYGLVFFSLFHVLAPDLAKESSETMKKLADDTKDTIDTFSLEPSSDEDTASATFKDVALNAEKLEGETVTVTGYGNLGGGLTNQAGYTVNLKCGEYKEAMNFRTGVEYKVTGVVGYEEGTQYSIEDGPFIECSQPPESTGNELEQGFN